MKPRDKPIIQEKQAVTGGFVGLRKAHPQPKNHTNSNQPPAHRDKPIIQGKQAVEGRFVGLRKARP